jgi:acyl-CoA synthetase (AMP-forming)/AMP-acid ligase II
MDVQETSVRGRPCRVYRNSRDSVAELLLDARRWRKRTALVGHGRRLTFAGQEAAARATAAHLVNLGVRPGDRVLILAPNSVEWVITLWATLLAGGVAALGNFWWSAAEVAQAIADITPVLVTGDEKRLGNVPASVQTRLLTDIAVLDPGEADGSGAMLPPGIGPDDPALVVFTSGSTGRPKGALLSNRNVVSAQHSLLLRTRRLPQQLTDDQPPVISLVTAPLFHLGGVGPLMTALIVGGTIVLPRGKFDAGEVLQLIQDERVTLWGAVPTMVARVLAHPGVAEFDTSSLRTIGLGGAPVPADLPGRIGEAFPTVVRGVTQMWGLTESSGVLTSAGGSEAVAHPGSSGLPIPVVELRIKDPDEDGSGEILARGPGVMLGYCNRPEENPVDDEGFLHTGDVGQIPADGHVYLTGRSKDVIIRGGENVSCSHVEEHLLTHPNVLEVAVVAMPHAELGEEVGAVVHLRPGSSVTTDELRGHAAASLAYFEVPTRWQLVPELLPTTPFGKIDKKAVRAAWLATEPSTVDA